MWNDVYGTLETLKLLEETFPKNISMIFKPPGAFPPVMLDPSQVHHLILNLCLNARDAMEHGGTLILSVRQERFEGHEYQILSVKDSGTGMYPETMKKIFDPFFSTKAKDKGSGLGLSQVSNIMERHQGFVTVESELGYSSTFHCWFPQFKMPASVQPVQFRVPNGAPRGSGTILIIEDEVLLREALAEYLTVKGFTVLSAGDGPSGVRLFNLQREEISLVISDIDLPIFSGEELIRQIRITDPLVRVILVSGFLNSWAQAAVIRNDGIRFVHKPYELETVFQLAVNMQGELAPTA